MTVNCFYLHHLMENVKFSLIDGLEMYFLLELQGFSSMTTGLIDLYTQCSVISGTSYCISTTDQIIRNHKDQSSSSKSESPQ